MTVDFNDYFWGEKNNGFDVLYHNMKYGLMASKELSEFFREKSNIEEQNSKMMSKLAHKANTVSPNGTFAPVWTILRTSAERLSTLHLQMVQKLSELVKDVAKYADELHKKHKTVKEEEAATLESVQAMQTSTTAVQKSRDLYTTRAGELDKLRKDNGTQKDMEKIEVKLRKLQDEYKTLLDKHNPIKSDFERRMTQTCKRFQEIEEVHLRQMREFLSTYLELLQNNHDMVGQVHSDFKRQFLDMSVDKLLEQFVLNKYTGLEKPEVAELEFIALSMHQQHHSGSSSTTRLNHPTLTATMSAGSKTNSNSASSIQAAAGSRLTPAGGAFEGGSGVSGGSIGSGSGSLLNADDSMLGFISNNATMSTRPISPDLLSANSLAATSMGSASATAAITTTATAATTNSASAAPSSSSTSAAGFVKNNFRNWFSSSIPSKQNAVPAGQANTLNAAANGGGNSNTNSGGASIVGGGGATGSSGNFGMESNGGGSSISTTISTPNTTICGTIGTTATTFTTTNNNNNNTTTATTTIMNKNSPNSELLLPSLLDTNNQAKDIITSGTRTVTTPSAGGTKLFNEHFSTSCSERSSPSGAYNHHHQHHPQLHHQPMSVTALPTATTPTTTTASARRTTSLLNIFTSNSQVSGILRSRRDKTKTKKSKKKKDEENGEHHIQEERLASIDRSAGNNGTAELDHDSQITRTKTQNSSGSSVGLPMSSAQGNVDSSGAGVLAPVGNSSAGIATGSNGTSSIAAGTGPKNHTISGTGAIGSGGFGDVDEDGYSAQPAKESAWEENNENAGSFYSDSDSDSDNDKPERRIHVKIKPLKNGQAPMSASVDELRATVENISLSPTGVYSQSQQLQHSRHVATSRQQSPEISNASTPTASVHPYAPLQSPTLSMSHNPRYAELGDIFSELGDMSVSAPASATLSKSNSRQIPTPTSTSSSIAIPRPPSRRSDMVALATSSSTTTTSGARGRNSPSPMNRADSIGSLEFRTAIGCMGSSRGPSPLTIGISDTIPLAVAFHEIIHAFFRGSEEARCQVKISGGMTISFPAGIAGLLANNPNPAKLGLRIKNVQNLEQFIPNAKLVQIDKTQSNALNTMLEFNMSSLTALLRRQAEHNPTASYFNVDILKYQVRTKPGALSCPFQLVSYWKCETNFTAIKVDYKYNNHAMASSSPLLNVTLSVPVNGSVRNVQSKPHSAWLGESNRLVWNFTDISQNSQDGGVGTLRARLELNEGPSTPALLSTQFNCEGTTLSGIEFDLQGSGYRLSLVKRRFVSGKYVCEGDGVRSCVTPTSMSIGSTSPYSAKST